MNDLDPARVGIIIDIKIEIKWFVSEFVRIGARIGRWIGSFDQGESLGPPDYRVPIISTVSCFLNRAIMKMHG